MVIPDDVLRALPSRVKNETEWQSAIRLALPRLCPMLLVRQIPGDHKEEGGGWLHGAPVGAADLGGWLEGGRAVQIECKFGRGKLSREQRRWQQTCFAWGVVHVVATGNAAESTVVQVVRVAEMVRAAVSPGEACHA